MMPWAGGPLTMAAQSRSICDVLTENHHFPAGTSQWRRRAVQSATDLQSIFQPSTCSVGANASADPGNKITLRLYSTV